MKVTGRGDAPWPGRMVYRLNTEHNVNALIDANSPARTEGVPFNYFPQYSTYKVAFDFYSLGTYQVNYDVTMPDSSDTPFTAVGTYTFHVGPAAELELQAAWDAPGVLTLTAVNHGPDNAPAVQVEVTPPPGLRFLRGEASQGTYHDDGVNPVWHIGELETPEYRRLLNRPGSGEALTIYTEPAVNTGTPGGKVTASIENTEDYCVRVKTATRAERIRGTYYDDLDCVGTLPSGYTEHSAAYYDHRPKNNRATLPADWTAVQGTATTRLTGLAFTSQGGYRPGDDIEVTATFNNDVTVSGQPRLRLRVGEITREAALHSHSYDTMVFRYRVQEGDIDAVDGVSIPPSPIALPQGAGISGPGGGRVSLFFAGLPDDPAHKVYPSADRVEGSNAPVWSPPEDLYTGVDGARYRLADRMRHYYRWNETTRRWEVEFRIADAGLDAPDQNLIQWLILRASGYHIGRPHAYGAAPVEMKPYLGGWTSQSQWEQQLCTGLKAEFSPGKTRDQRLEELKDVEIHWFSRVAYGDGEYQVSHREDVDNSLGTARGIAAEAPCPDPPTGTVTINGQQSTRGEFGAVLYDPNGVVQGSETWQWKRSPEGANAGNVGYTGFQNIAGATGSTYAPGAEDAGRYLRVKATYTDGQAQRRTAWGQSEGPVTGQVQESPQPPAARPQPAGQTVPADSPIIPDGMDPGDSFRLLFVTSTTTTAESADIADYNGIAQARAAANSNLADFSGQFRALISTAGVNIKDNTATTGTGVPVHWLGGEKAADDYADLYDVSWDSVSGLTETGSSYTGLVWTGGNGYGETSLRRYAGAAEVRMGDLSDDTRALSSPTHKAATEAYPLYAISPVLTVTDVADRQGTVSFDADPPQADAALTATLLDPDGVVTGSVAWQWQRSPQRTTPQDVDTASFENIPGASGAAYTPVDEDVGRWLRATANYADGHGPGKTARARTSGPVSGQVQGAPPQQQAAVITKLELHTSGPYGLGDAISVGVVFDREITVAGTPELSIELGGSPRTAIYDATQSGPIALSFSYMVQEGDTDAYGVGVYPGSISLPQGASIRDDRGNDAVLLHSGLAPQPGHTVDAPATTTGAAITGLAMHSSGPYGEGDAISVAAIFDRQVNVVGAPELHLEVGGSPRTAVYDATRSGPIALSFSYTVQEGDADADGVSVYPGSIVLPQGASIRDAQGSEASLSISGLPPQPGHTVDAPADTTSPAVVAGPLLVSDPDAAGPDDDTYARGNVIEAALTFSEAVTVGGEPRVRLRMGERNRWARYDRSEGNGTRLVFAYVVRDNDRDDDGISVEENLLRLNGGSIADARGNPADLSHPALADQAGHKVDGSLEGQPVQRQRAANNEPQFGAESDSRSVDENAAAGTNVGNVIVATDLDGDTLTYALTGSAAFVIDVSSGQISVASGAVLDHETQASYSLTITVSDGKNAEGNADASVDDTITVTVSVVNVDEPGVVSLESQADPPKAGSELRATLLDRDGGVGGVTWAWQRSSDGTNWAAIEGASGASYTPSDDDVGRYLRATASYADGHGPGKSAVAATASKVEPAPPAQQQQAAPTVAADSPLVPEGLEPGDRFRLLFVTSTTTKAESADIASYNAFVQARAAANTNLAGFSGQFRALISTAGVNIKDNTATTGTGVPVHWLGGEKAADDYADLYDVSWDSVSGLTETGSSYTGLVWTGGNGYGETSLRRYAGAAEVRMGDLSDDTRALSSPTHKAATEAYPLYALSPVLTVAQPEPEQPGQQQKAANNQPQFAAESDSRSVDENAAAGTSVGQPIIATDPDGDPLTYALSGSGAFAIDASSGQISVASGAALDHETQESYTLTVTVSDGRNAAGEADAFADDSMIVTVSVVNVDEKGKVSVDLDPPRSGSPLRASLLDPDGVAGGSVKWQWKRSPDGTTAQNVDATDFSDIPGATGASYTPVEGDVGRWLRVLAIYTDPFGSGKRARAQTANPVERKQAPPPTVTGVAVVSDPGDDDTYVLDDVIRVRVTFSEAVNVSGNPRIKIDMDPADWGEKWAAYEGGGGTNSLTFTHTVVEPNFSSRGIAVLADSLELNGGGIASVSASVSANLSHTGLGHDPNHKVDWQG